MLIVQHIEKRNTQRFMDFRAVSPATVLANSSELNGLLISARQACAHASCLNLDDLQALNAKIEREKRQELERKMYAKGQMQAIFEEKKQGKSDLTRAQVFKQAVDKARAHAKARMRSQVLKLQSSEIEFVSSGMPFSE